MFPQGPSWLLIPQRTPRQALSGFEPPRKEFYVLLRLASFPRRLYIDMDSLPVVACIRRSFFKAVWSSIV